MPTEEQVIFETGMTKEKVKEATTRLYLLIVFYSTSQLVKYASPLDRPSHALL